jgi:hypothetical protein
MVLRRPSLNIFQSSLLFFFLKENLDYTSGWTLAKKILKEQKFKDKGESPQVTTGIRNTKRKADQKIKENAPQHLGETKIGNAKFVMNYKSLQGFGEMSPINENNRQLLIHPHQRIC